MNNSWIGKEVKIEDLFKKYSKEIKNAIGKKKYVVSGAPGLERMELLVYDRFDKPPIMRYIGNAEDLQMILNQLEKEYA